MTFTVSNVISCFNSTSGGPPRTVAMISQASVGYWRAELFTTNYLTSAEDRLLIRDFAGHVNLLPASAYSRVSGLLRTAGILRSYEVQLFLGIQPDIIHVHGMWHPLLAACALSALRRQIPYVVAPHGMLDPWCLKVRRRRKAVALRSYQGRVIAAAAALHATSEQEAENLRRLPCVQAPIFVVPNAVEVPEEAAPRRDGTSSEPRTLLFLSRLHAQKGLDMLLQAWHELRPKEWQLAVAGTGAPRYVEALKLWCQQRGLRSVVFVGQIEGEDREALYRRASALVLPSYSESFGNVVAEALIRGLPVITTTATPWSLLTEQRCGWFIEPKLEPLKAALAQLLHSDAQQLELMGNRGREYALRRFSIAGVRQTLLDMYGSVLRRAAPRTQTTGPKITEPAANR
jgi:glycosyltransferase involved in cell wall biosynthesis